MTPPAIPWDRELRVYYRLAQRDGELEPFLVWRRRWIADQPKHLAALRAQRVGAPPERGS